MFLPGVKREIPALSREASLNLDDAARALLQNGIDRPRSDEEQNMITLDKGDKLTFTFGEEKEISDLRLMLDFDYSKMSVSPNRKMRIFPMKLNRGKDFVPVKVAATLVKHLRVIADGKVVWETENNYYSLLQIPLKLKARTVEIEFLETWGAERVNLFACDLR